MGWLNRIWTAIGHALGAGRSPSEALSPPPIEPPLPAGAAPDRLKLVTIIAHEEEADRILDALVGRGYPATKIASSGGLLHRGMATILSGVEAAEVDGVVFLVKEVCPARYKPLTQAMRLPRSRTEFDEQTEVRVGGAVVFVQDVERFEKT